MSEPTYFEGYLAERLKEPAVRAGYERAQRAPVRRLVITAAIVAAVIIATCWWLARTIGELE